MGRKVETTYHFTEEEARAEQRAATGTDNYSETYGKGGVMPCRVIDPKTGREIDGWKCETVTYYG